MDLHNGRVIALQSDNTTLTLYHELFGDEPTDFRVVPSLSHVLDEVRTWTPDLLILNCSQGFEPMLALCERIRSDSDLSSVPIIVVSSIADKSARYRAFEAGVDEYFAKPFDTEEFKIRVGRMLRNHQFRVNHAEKNLFFMLSQRLPYPLAMVDINDKVVYANVHAQMDFNLESARDKRWQDVLAESCNLYNNDEWAKANGRVTSAKTLLMNGHRHGVDGRLRWFTCHLFPLAEDPSGRKVICVVDASADMELQDLLLGVKRLVTHKLRTPINGLLGPLDMLNEDEQMDAQERKSIIKLALQSAERLSAAVNDMERYFVDTHSRSASQPISVADAAGMVRLCAGEQLAELLECRVESCRSSFLPIDARQCYNIFTELFDNSVKFHPKHSPRLKIEFRKDGDSVLVVAEDDGIYADTASLAYLATPLFQREAALTGEMAGVGMGLAQVARIIYSCGGDINFSGKSDGPGLRVKMRLPIHGKAA